MWLMYFWAALGAYLIAGKGNREAHRRAVVLAALWPVIVAVRLSRLRVRRDNAVVERVSQLWDSVKTIVDTQWVDDLTSSTDKELK